MTDNKAQNNISTDRILISPSKVLALVDNLNESDAAISKKIGLQRNWISNLRGNANATSIEIDPEEARKLSEECIEAINKLDLDDVCPNQRDTIKRLSLDLRNELAEVEWTNIDWETVDLILEKIKNLEFNLRNLVFHISLSEINDINTQLKNITTLAANNKKCIDNDAASKEIAAQLHIKSIDFQTIMVALFEKFEERTFSAEYSALLATLGKTHASLIPIAEKAKRSVSMETAIRLTRVLKCNIADIKSEDEPLHEPFVINQAALANDKFQRLLSDEHNHEFLSNIMCRIYDRWLISLDDKIKTNQRFEREKSLIIAHISNVPNESSESRDENANKSNYDIRETPYGWVLLLDQAIKGLPPKSILQSSDINQEIVCKQRDKKPLLTTGEIIERYKDKKRRYVDSLNNRCDTDIRYCKKLLAETLRKAIDELDIALYMCQDCADILYKYIELSSPEEIEKINAIINQSSLFN